MIGLKLMGKGGKKQLVRLGVYYFYLLLVWGSFRYWIRLPEVVEELWFKPVIWLLPLYWWRISLKGKPELFSGKWLVSGGWGVAVGVLYFVLLKVLGAVGQTGWNLDLLGIALVTAIVEELTFSGLVLGVLDWVRGKKGLNLIVVGLMVVGVHLPINIFVFGLRGRELVGVLLWLFSVAVINGGLRQKTGNVVGSIVARFGLMFSVLG